eukprot:TRINITY_DN50763_c0_g1_i1.p2 TRINITY_DN50763_c0_g1~~TRINITY_DN50763_c0_g1_i1.p2  ORF type:complete len:483 (+),score=111.17 TRINITY_DN50763_c0_g1_i1:91-1539(+)
MAPRRLLCAAPLAATAVLVAAALRPAAPLPPRVPPAPLQPPRVAPPPRPPPPAPPPALGLSRAPCAGGGGECPQPLQLRQAGPVRFDLCPHPGRWGDPSGLGWKAPRRDPSGKRCPKKRTFVCKISAKAAGKPTSPELVWIEGMRAMINAYGGAWLAPAGLFAAADFDPRRRFWRREGPLEGPSFVLAFTPGVSTLKTDPVSHFWVHHLSWLDQYLTVRAGCGVNASAPRLGWCREELQRRLRELPPPPAPEPPAGGARVVSLIPFYWSSQPCAARLEDRSGDCYTSGRATTPALRLAQLRRVAAAHWAYFGNGTVIGVCDEAARTAVAGALGGVPVLGLLVLRCREKGPQLRPQWRSGLALPWLLLEQARPLVRDWNATHVFYNEPDQVPFLSNLSGVLAGAAGRAYVVPHRLEEWPEGDLRVGGDTVRLPAPPRSARAFSLPYGGGRVALTTTAGSPQGCGPHAPQGRYSFSSDWANRAA